MASEFLSGLSMASEFGRMIGLHLIRTPNNIGVAGSETLTRSSSAHRCCPVMRYWPQRYYGAKEIT